MKFHNGGVKINFIFLDQVGCLYNKVIKSITFKNLFTGIVLIFITFYIKDLSIASYILNLFNLNNTEFNLTFLSGFLALILRLLLKGILDLIFETDVEYIMPGNNENYSFEEKRPLIFNKNSDSGSDQNSSSVPDDNISSSNNLPSSSAEASSSRDKPFDSKEGKGVVTDSDYEWESDNSNPAIYDYYSDDSNNDKESEVSKFINSRDFEDRVKRATLDELSEALNTIDKAKSLYENSTVPSKNEQIALLNKKEALCLAEIEHKLIELENTVEKVQDKGKGKEIEK